jgi:hypothetical protein
LQFQRKTLAGARERHDHFARLAELRNHTFDPCKDSLPHSNSGANRSSRVRAEWKSSGKTITDPVDFLATHDVLLFITQHPQYARRGNHMQPILCRKAHKHIPGKERPLQDHGPVRPLLSLRIERHIVFYGTNCEMLCNPLFMIGIYV